MSTDTLGYGDYLRFRDLVHQHSGLYFPDKKRHDLAHGLFKSLHTTTHNISDLDAYYQFLQQEDPSAQAELRRFINNLTIGETHFFRDTPQFDALAHHVLPAIIQRKRAEAQATDQFTSHPQLRVWSAGCASGEEAYSLAMLLHELIPDIDLWHILILATDINNDSLIKAQRAVYSDWSFREPRALSLRSIYFKRHEDNRYSLLPKIKHMVSFRRHNLVEDDFPSPATNTVAMDLILCRNVTIYFSEETTRQLLDKFHQSLVFGGWLAVGHSEPSLTLYQQFTSRSYPGTVIYQKTDEPSPLPFAWQTTGTKPNANQTLIPTPATINNWSSPTIPTPATPATPLPTSTLAPPTPINITKLITTVCNLLEQGQPHLAEQKLNQTLPHIPTNDRGQLYALLAQAQANQNKWQQARTTSLQAIQLNNLLPEAYFVLALIDDHDDDPLGAIENLKKVTYLDNQHPLAYFHLAMLYRRLSRDDAYYRALRNARKILDQWPDDKPVPQAGGTQASRLLYTITQLIRVAEGGRNE
ncbi:MAG TPA: CheR family methyltransferase [Anaerolineae bacterium]|nr:CheR family methyltransferase [Anaerolineae bacterium]